MYNGVLDGIGLETLQWDWWGVARVLIVLGLVGLWGATRNLE